MTDQAKLEKAYKVIADAARWLVESGKEQKYMIKQTRNLGDTLHLTPIIRHYRLKHPNAAIVFICGKAYENAHELNPHVNKIMTVDHNLNPQERIAIRQRMLTFESDNFHVIAPSIHPFGKVWKGLAWSYENIADQYLHNAGIKNLKPEGGRGLVLKISDEDNEWAKHFLSSRKLDPKRCIVLEYNSYSHPLTIKGKDYRNIIRALRKNNVTCICVAGKGEALLQGAIDARGISWRKTAALLNKVAAMVGVGSGITMIAAACKNKPLIIEVAVPPSITMKACGYADSVRAQHPEGVIKRIAEHVR